jgi:transcriptional regulator with XRE-family HTH domain
MQRPTSSLGHYLALIRDSRGLTLRAVAKATENAVSNPYLSQLETGKIKKPSPHILYALANLYGISYEDLMRRAGYLQAKEAKRSIALAGHSLSADEEAELLNYLAYLRFRNKRQKVT